jgi:hypothetical protein
VCNVIKPHLSVCLPNGQHYGDDGEKQSEIDTIIRKNKQERKTVLMYVMYSRQTINGYMVTNGYVCKNKLIGTDPLMPICL